MVVSVSLFCTCVLSSVPVHSLLYLLVYVCVSYCGLRPLLCLVVPFTLCSPLVYVCCYCYPASVTVYVCMSLHLLTRVSLSCRTYYAHTSSFLLTALVFLSFSLLVYVRYPSVSMRYPMLVCVCILYTMLLLLLYYARRPRSVCLLLLLLSLLVSLSSSLRPSCVFVPVRFFPSLCRCRSVRLSLSLVPLLV